MQTSFSLTVRGKTLRGIAHLPEQEHCPCLVLCHGLTGCAHERTLMAIAKSWKRTASPASAMTASAAVKATVCPKKRPLLPKRKIRLP